MANNILFEVPPEETNEVKLESLEMIFTAFFSAIDPTTPIPTFDNTNVKNSEEVYFTHNLKNWHGKFQTKSFSDKGTRFHELKFTIPNNGFIFTNSLKSLHTFHGKVIYQKLNYSEAYTKIPSIFTFAEKWFPEKPKCTIYYSDALRGMIIKFNLQNVFLTFQFELGFPEKSFLMEWMQDVTVFKV